jgi:hypothetical protein
VRAEKAAGGDDQQSSVVPRGHRLATRRVITLSDAAGEPWIDIRCEVGCCRAATSAAFQRRAVRTIPEADLAEPGAQVRIS